VPDEGEETLGYRRPSILKELQDDDDDFGELGSPVRNKQEME